MKNGKVGQMSFTSSTFTIPSQKTVHLGEEAMRMVLSRMPLLTSLKVKKNIRKIIIAKFIFKIIMILPILWMRIRMILSRMQMCSRFTHKIKNTVSW